MCIGCVLRFLVCGGYVSKGRVCHMWGCEYVLPMMDCWGVFLPYGVRCECWRAYILGGVFTGVGYHVCTVSFLVFYSL